MTKSSGFSALRYFYPLLLLPLPFVFVRLFSDPVMSPLYLLLCLLCMGWLAYSQRHIEPLSAAARIMWLLLAALWCTGLASALINRANSEAIYELCRTGALLLFFYTHVRYLSQPDSDVASAVTPLRSLVYGVSLMALGYLCVGLYEAMELGGDFLDMEGSYAVRAHLGHRNLMAVFYTLSLPLYVYLYQSERRPWLRYAAAAAGLITAIMLVLLASRVGWLGLLVVAAICGIRAAGHYRQHRRGTLPVIAAMLIAAAIAGGVIATHSQSIKNITHKLRSFAKIHEEIDPNTYTINERLELWQQSLRMAGRHPLWGVGPGMWQFHYMEGGLRGTQAQSGRALFQRPHNDLLWYLCEYGIGGLLLFLSLIGFGLWLAYRALRSELSEEAYLALSGLLVFVVVCSFDFPKERPVHLFLLAFYLAVAAVCLPFSKNIKLLRRLRDSDIAIATALMGGMLCMFFVIRLQGEYALNQALAARLGRDYPAVRAAVTEAKNHWIKYDLSTTPLEFYLGEAAFYEGRSTEALEHLSTARQQNPYHLYTMSDMGSCYWLLGRRAEAMAMWDSAISIAPSFGEGRINKSIALFSTGDTIGAARNLHYRMLTEDTTIYRHQIVVIYGCLIISTARGIDEPQVREQMLQIAQRDQWIVDLYYKMIKYADSPAAAALKEALWTLENQQKAITAEQRKAIWQKYEDRLK